MCDDEDAGQFVKEVYASSSIHLWLLHTGRDHNRQSAFGMAGVRQAEARLNKNNIARAFQPHQGQVDKTPRCLLDSEQSVPAISCTLYHSCFDFRSINLHIMLHLTNAVRITWQAM